MFIRDIKNPKTLLKFLRSFRETKNIYHIWNDFSDSKVFISVNDCLPRWINKQKYYFYMDNI